MLLLQVLETFEDEEHGSLARVEVGQVTVQQVDITYVIYIYYIND